MGCEVLPGTLTELLENTARNFPQKGIYFYDNGLDQPAVFVSYVELLRKATENAHLLAQHEITQVGNPVILCFDSNYRNIMWAWSVIIAGGVPAIMQPLPQDESARSALLQNMGRLFAPRPIILTEDHAKHHFGTPSNPQIINSSIIYTVENIQNLAVSTASRDIVETVHKGIGVETSSLAALLFTSGSTGHSKAVRFTHRQLIRSVAAKQKYNGVTPETRFMSWITFDHSVNFCELHLNAMYSGCDQLQLKASDLVSDPSSFYKIISDERIGYTFSPNSFLAIANRALISQEPLNLNFKHLQILFTGGEVTQTKTLEVADQIVRRHGAPTHSIVSVYGLSETCSACFYNKMGPEYDIEHGYVFASVGRHLSEGVQLRIVDDDGTPRSFNSSGHVQLSGEIIFDGYYNNKSATADSWKENGWFKTGDLGLLDSNGNLVVVGRTKELLVINGQKYSSSELEHAIELSNSGSIVPSYCATFSCWDSKGDSESIVVLFSPQESLTQWYDIEKLRDACRQINASVVKFCSKPAMDIIPLPRSEMPKSTIGKLSRHKLKQYYEKGSFDKYRVPIFNKAQELRDPASSFQTETERVLGTILSKEASRPLWDIYSDTDMFSFGLDSIAYIRLKTLLEQELGMEKGSIPMSVLLGGTSVREVAALIDDLSSLKEITYDPLVNFCSTGSKTPLFLFPPAGGEILNFLPVLSFLPDRPVYGFRIRGLDKNDRGFESMDEMLDSFEVALRRARPKGPYAFLGLCAGTVSAFELCKRFNNSPSPTSSPSSNEVVFCGGIDCPPFVHELTEKYTLEHFIIELCALHQLIPHSEVAKLEAEILTKLEAEDAVNSPEVTPSVSSASAGSSIDGADSDTQTTSSASSVTDPTNMEPTKPNTILADKGARFMAGIIDHFGVNTLSKLNLQFEGMMTWWKVMSSMVEIVKAYRPSGKVSQMDIFAAKEEIFQAGGSEWMEKLRGWEMFVENKDVRVREIDGNHFDVLTEQNLASFADALNQAMDARGA